MLGGKKTVSLASIELKYFLVLIYYKSTEDYKNEQSQSAEIWTENYFRVCCCSVISRVQTLCDPMDCSMPGFPVLHYLLESAQAHVHWIGDAIQPSHPLLPPSPPAFSLSQRQGLPQWVSSLHQVVKVSELQLQHQSSNEYSGLISFRMTGLTFLQSMGFSRVLSSTTVQKHQIFGA